eukprot:tig00000430_g638.t1
MAKVPYPADGLRRDIDRTARSGERVRSAVAVDMRRFAGRCSSKPLERRFVSSGLARVPAPVLDSLRPAAPAIVMASSSERWQDPAVAAHTRLLLSSFRRVVGRPLMDLGGKDESDPDVPRMVYEAPFVLVSHGTEQEPIFNYANRAGQALWEMDWGQFTRTPSKDSAEPGLQEARLKVLHDVEKVRGAGRRTPVRRHATRQGYTEGYSGVRISASGRRFRIVDVVVWNVLDEAGAFRGQAATFPRWEFL